jgi:hypothetical protein
MNSEQTTDQTFRVTSTPDGRIGVSVFIDGKPCLVLWLDSHNPSAAERLALHLETQIDRVSCAPALHHSGEHGKMDDLASLVR